MAAGSEVVMGVTECAHSSRILGTGPRVECRDSSAEKLQRTGTPGCSACLSSAIQSRARLRSLYDIQMTWL